MTKRGESLVFYRHICFFPFADHCQYIVNFGETCVIYTVCRCTHMIALVFGD
jgi:hypothetical protein